MTKVQVHLTNRDVFVFEDARDLDAVIGMVRQILSDGGTFVVRRYLPEMAAGTVSVLRGERLAARRKELGWTQGELAGRMKRSISWVGQVERGTRRIDRLSVLSRLAQVLDVPVSGLTSPAGAKPIPVEDVIVVPATSVSYVQISEA